MFEPGGGIRGAGVSTLLRLARPLRSGNLFANFPSEATTGLIIMDGDMIYERCVMLRSDVPKYARYLSLAAAGTSLRKITAEEGIIPTHQL